MESVFNLQTLFPLSLVLLQTVFVSLMAYLILDWWRMIKRPLEGMEYGPVIICAGFIFSSLVISSSSVDSIYESFRNYVSQGKGWAPLMWAKFFQFMLVVCTAQLMFAGIVWMLLRVTLKKNTKENITSEHLVTGMFALAVMLGMSFILKEFARNMIGDLVPRFKAFNGF
ncbi:hypothetical protein LZZ85_00540 [Terrimonas sp. NA20]|uniref:Uncharacterized protein n=1 Tax=Terrimonas ginsenosidimutans TaxID=2908004 RepID=A0ABS9KKA1_9BACT|nr:hypothetical protein [Terrimonas ginsenosidimutans]MCG2612738.1 hypothetical protein [Terrimonas ginsenosidimutans]